MVKRWLLYLVALIVCTVFCIASQTWLSWVILLTVTTLPLLSLLLSLPSMLTVKPQLIVPGHPCAGTQAMLEVRIHSHLPLPPCSCRFRVTHSLTGSDQILYPGDYLPTEHCGQILCKSTTFFVYDYMNLFRLRRTRLPEQEILVHPVPLATTPPKTLERHIARSWQPKHGGGFAENHELRLYRPGDALNQIHWKLSSKTGKLVVREAMIPRQGRVLLTADLVGHPNQLDRKLGRIVWMGRHLLEQGLHFDLHVLTGQGPLLQHVHDEWELERAVHALLRARPAPAGTVLDSISPSAWKFHIGGDRT